MWLTLVSALSFGQDAPVVPPMSVETWRMPVDARSTLWADDTALYQGPIARVTFTYTNSPLAYTWESGERMVVLRDVLRSDVIAGYTYGRARFAVDVPVYWHLTGDSLESGGGLGDVALDLKLVALKREDGPVGVGFATRVLLPTATVSAPVATSGVGFEGTAVIDRAFGPVLIAANVGTQIAPKVGLENLTLNDAFVARIGAGWAKENVVGVSLDVGSRFNYTSPLLSEPGVPIEALLGGWARIGSSDFVVHAGAGRGLTMGIGAPVARGILAFGFEPPVDRDADDDGLFDAVDACPFDPEDVDGYLDDDGCPEADNDDDGLLDAVDQCPMEAEDLDAWQDADGCPDPWTKVTLKVVDPAGAPVLHAAIRLGEQTVTGPELVAELMPGTFDLDVAADGFAPHGGSIAVPDGPPIEIIRRLRLPDPTTGTLSLVVTDPGGKPVDSRWAIGERAPQEMPGGLAQVTLPPGIYQLVVSADNYLPAAFPAQVELGRDSQLSVMLQPVRVQVTREKLDIQEKVFFETNKATILPQSFGLLDEVASILLDRPDILRVRIEGHTDSRGSDAYNQGLSETRAQSVRDYLVARGVDASRLVNQGFGESRPLDARELAVAWDQNRRVEFFIEAWAE